MKPAASPNSGWSSQELPDYPSVIKAMGKWLGLPPMEKTKTKSKPLDPKNIVFAEPKATASNQPDPAPAAGDRRPHAAAIQAAGNRLGQLPGGFQ